MVQLQKCFDISSMMIAKKRNLWTISSLSTFFTDNHYFVHVKQSMRKDNVTRERRNFLSSSLSSSSSNLQQQQLQQLPPPSLSKVLVANRGEIACRIIRTCRRLEIPTVAIYSVADGPYALHAQMADEAYLIGTGPTPAESYLLQHEIVQLAQTVGAHAIHPGYGFLSENAQFAQLIHNVNQEQQQQEQQEQQQSSSNLVFVGPPPKAIQAMGSKSESKAIMDAAGVPTTPGYYETKDTWSTTTTPQDVDVLRSRAIEIGFPILIKAVMGGGGKGMRLVWNEKDFISHLESCQRESFTAFGNSTILLEKYLVNPRHVEIQIIADNYDNIVTLYERDCSLQRRHQKVIEEAPASDLSISIQQKLSTMAKKAAQAVGYVNAGTVEFLLDTQKNMTNNNKNKNNNDDESFFYFCEMNTRLQVEHAITEEITGIDLVEWQLRVAAGESLPIMNTNDIACHGHAFEARIYAEQPTRQFLPATGTIYHHGVPTTTRTTSVDNSNNNNNNNIASTTTTTTTPGTLHLENNNNNHIRVDTSIQMGHEISVYYDPMISKLIVYGPNRRQALDRFIQALQDYEIAGVPTNLDFLIQCAKHDIFQIPGAMNTGFLHDYYDLNLLNHDRYMKQQVMPPLAQVVGTFTALLYLEQRRGMNPMIGNTTTTTTAPAAAAAAAASVRATTNHHPQNPWSSSQGSWRLGGSAGRARRILNLCHSGSSSSNDDDDDDEETKMETVECISNPDGSFEILVAIVPNDDDGGDGSNDKKEQDNDSTNTTVPNPPGRQSFHIQGGFVNNNEYDNHNNNNNNNNEMEVMINETQKIRLTSVLREEKGQIIVNMWPKNLPSHYAWEVRLEHPFAPETANAKLLSMTTGATTKTKTTTTGPKGKSIKAPMPGKISRINHVVGSMVTKDNVVIVMEAMKMEHSIKATMDGIVTTLQYKVGDIVGPDDLLFEISSSTSTSSSSKE